LKIEKTRRCRMAYEERKKQKEEGAIENIELENGTQMQINRKADRIRHETYGSYNIIDT